MDLYPDRESCKTVENYKSIIPHDGSIVETLGLYEKLWAAGPACEAIAEGQFSQGNRSGNSVPMMDTSADSISNGVSVTSPQLSSLMPPQPIVTMPGSSTVLSKAQVPDGVEVSDDLRFEELVPGRTNDV
ncbi:uncharacterized protein RHO25_013200 [Cercospora beticola]|uniref:Uncharacterized protein n=1 Tax=Cercospora beticola TaxID=122368 RepID=A0ABZ0P9J4_CERBT|nr:hypothetical protein RHO25_013200 [Cercospora beticola]